MKRVLIVDDDEAILDSLSMVLEEAYEVVTATDAGRAFDAVRGGRRFDVILLDLMIPGLNGAAIKAALDRQGIDTPVLVISAGAKVEEQAVAMGAAGYLVKPFSLPALEAKLEELIAEG